MKKKWAAVPLMLMLIVTGTVLAACSDKEPAEEPAGRVIHVSVDGSDAGDYDLERLADPDKQLLIPEREDVLDGFRSLKEGKGSFFVPDEEYMHLYGLKED